MYLPRKYTPSLVETFLKKSLIAASDGDVLTTTTGRCDHLEEYSATPGCVGLCITSVSTRCITITYVLAAPFVTKATTSCVAAKK